MLIDNSLIRTIKIVNNDKLYITNNNEYVFDIDDSIVYLDRDSLYKALFNNGLISSNHDIISAMVLLSSSIHGILLYFSKEVLNGKFESGVFDKLVNDFNSIDKRCLHCDNTITYSIDLVYGSIIDNGIHDCYIKDINKRIDFNIVGDSGKIVILNDIRKYLKVEYDFDNIFGSLDTDKGIEDTILNFYSIDVLVQYVGNNYLDIYKHNNSIVLSNDSGNSYGNSYGSVCCDLWWIMVTRIENIDMDMLNASGDDYVIIDSIPNNVISFDYNNWGEDYIKIDL